MSKHQLRWDEVVITLAHTRLFSPEHAAGGWPERMTPQQLATLQWPYAAGEGTGQAMAEMMCQRILQSCERGMLAFTAAGRYRKENEPPSISAEEFARWLKSKEVVPNRHVVAWLASQPLRAVVTTTNSNLTEATQRAMGLETTSAPDTDADQALPEPARPPSETEQSLARRHSEEAAVAWKAGSDAAIRRGLPSSDIAYCFMGVHWPTEAAWKQNLSDKPKWLDVAVMTLGQRGKRETVWDPILVGDALVRKNPDKIHQVRARFQKRDHLAPWKEAWNDHEADQFGEL